MAKREDPVWDTSGRVGVSLHAMCVARSRRTPMHTSVGQRILKCDYLLVEFECTGLRKMTPAQSLLWGEPLEPPPCPWLAHFSFHFRVENLGSYLPGRSHSCFSLRNSSLVMRRLCSLPSKVWSPWRGIHSRTQRVLQPRSSFAFKWPRAVWSCGPLQAGHPWAVTSAVRDPVPPPALQASTLQLDA